MKKIVIHNFALIDELDLCLDKKLDVIIGAQASGKSILSKLIYFCRKVKDYMLEYLTEPQKFVGMHQDEYYTYFLKFIWKKFMGCFGTIKHMKPFQVDFYYNWTELEISDVPNKKLSLMQDMSGYVKVVFSEVLAEQIKKLLSESAQLLRDSSVTDTNLIGNLLSDLKIKQTVRQHFMSITAELFEDWEEILYIPAGRSILPVLSEQLYNLDVSAGDLPLQEFIGLIQNTKKSFGTQISEIVCNYTKTIDESIKNTDVALAYRLVKEILCGDYVNESDGEKLFYNEKEYIKLIYASSGQQEVLWILLLIFIRILEQKKAFIVLEEPEAHLFPAAQKKVIELIALLINSTAGSVFITTHSPYILTSINLLVYSAKVENNILVSAPWVIHKMLRIPPKQMDAFMLSNENAFSFVSIKDEKEQLIDAVQIDKVSEIINGETEKIMDLKIQYERGQYGENRLYL